MQQTVKWFGEDWGAPICKEDSKVETPVDWYCAQCSRLIQAKDQGVMLPHLGGPLQAQYVAQYVAWHLDCFLESLGTAPVCRSRAPWEEEPC